MTPMAFDKDVLRLQTGDCWAWCQAFRDVVFTGPSGTMASTSSSSAAPTIAQACMLCYGTLIVARRIGRAQRGQPVDFLELASGLLR